MTGSVHGAIRSFGRADDDAMEGEEEENRERRRRSVGERRGGGGERNGRGNNSSSFRRRQERREEGDKEAFLVEGVAKAEGRREEAECQYPPVIGRRRKGSVVGEMLSRRNVYQVSSPTEKRRGDAGGDDPRLYCDCPVHRKQRERMESNNNNNNNGDSVGSSSFSDMSKIGGALGSSPGKSFTSWLSNIQLSRTPSAREPSRPPAPASTSLRSSKSLRGERPPPPPKLSRPPLSVEYSNSRFTGSSGEVDGGGGGGVAVDGRGSDVSRPQVRLQGITRRGTMYPMRTSVSSSEFAAAAAGFGSMVAVGGAGGTANGNFAPHGSGTFRKGLLPQQKASTEV